jgi:hypothetical protein
MNGRRALLRVLLVGLTATSLSCGKRSPVQSAKDTTALTITGTTPASSATAVNVLSTVTATFSKPIGPGSLTGASFKLAAGSTPVAGALSLSPSGTTATFTPSSALAGNTVFTATVTSDIADVAGNPLASNTSWSFTTATAFDLRAPQIAFNNASLQAYMDTSDGGINTATAQLNSQVREFAGNVVFTLMAERSGSAASNTFGLYNAGATSPAAYQIFPGAATAGWFAAVNISGSTMSVALFDAAAVFQGQATYMGVTSTNLGFYLRGPGGTFYSQDSQNGANPQILTYVATGQHLGAMWECFEDTPWASGSRDFDDTVILAESLTPRPHAPADD